MAILNYNIASEKGYFAVLGFVSKIMIEIIGFHYPTNQCKYRLHYILKGKTSSVLIWTNISLNLDQINKANILCHHKMCESQSIVLDKAKNMVAMPTSNV